jgi:sulfonate transport system substrate-binding protein
MSRTVIRLAGAAALAAATGVLAACGNSGPAAAPASTSPAAATSAASGSTAADVVASAPTANPAWSQFHFVIADNGGDGTQALASILGTFKDASYSVSFARFSYGPPLVEALVTGKADIGSVGDVPPITGAATEYGFKIVGIQRAFTQGESGEDIIVKANSGIKTLADLKGKTIAVPQGSSANGLALLALNSVGLKPSDVKLVFLDPATGAQAFASGQVDAWAIWNPQATLAVEHSGGRVLVYGKPPIDQDNSYYVASQADLANPVKRAALADVLERIGEQFKYARLHPAVYAQAIEQEDGISAADARAYVATLQYKVNPIEPADIAAENQLAALFFESGQLKTKVNVASITDNLLPAGYDSSKANVSNLPER